MVYSLIKSLVESFAHPGLSDSEGVDKGNGNRSTRDSSSIISSSIISPVVMVIMGAAVEGH